jgi:arylsulfatase A-like enzyme
MKYFKFSALFMALYVLFSFACLADNGQKPNVIFIFPDQFRNFSLGFWSQDDNASHIQGKPDPTHTPALDKLANDGVVFNRAMSNFPLCSPFRGMLMSGKYPYKNGITANCHKNRKVGIKADGKSMANIFTNEGYETAYFGKCHWQRTEPLFDENGTYVGTKKSPGGHYINAYDTYVPDGDARLGYKYFFQTLRDTHFDPLVYSNDPKTVEGRKDGELYQPKRFSAELESDVLLDYLDNTHGQRDTSKPFFITWSLNPPHNPWTEESTDMAFFPQYTENGKVDIENLLVRGNADDEVGVYAPYYFANISAVDFYIGKILDKLKEMGIEDNTIIIFASDHGEMLGSHGLKGKPYPEVEAFNIPFVIKWGDKLEHRIEDLMLSVPDIMPTLLGLAGFEEAIPGSVQGTDYSDVLMNPASSKVKKPGSVLYFDYTSRGFFTGDYTFVVKEDGKGKFEKAFYYDNVKDPYQLHRIEGDEMNARLVKKFKSGLVAKLKAIDDKWAQDQICGEYLKY